MQTFPDTIILDPYLGGEVKSTDPQPAGGRLMNALPHIDGLVVTSILATNSVNLVLTRNGKGDWSYNRTAAGAETYFLRTTLSDLLRTGETYQLGDFGSPGLQTYFPSGPAKGVQVLNVFAILSVGVVPLTTAMLRLGKSVYPLTGAVAAAPVQTDLIAATNIATAVTGAGLYETSQLAMVTPVFSTDDLGLVEIELELVMAITGTVQVVGIGAHVAFNYN